MRSRSYAPMPDAGEAVGRPGPVATPGRGSRRPRRTHRGSPSSACSSRSIRPSTPTKQGGCAPQPVVRRRGTRRSGVGQLLRAGARRGPPRRGAAGASAARPPGPGCRTTRSGPRRRARDVVARPGPSGRRSGPDQEVRAARRERERPRSAACRRAQRQHADRPGRARVQRRVEPSRQRTPDPGDLLPARPSRPAGAAQWPHLAGRCAPSSASWLAASPTHALSSTYRRDGTGERRGLVRGAPAGTRSQPLARRTAPAPSLPRRCATRTAACRTCEYGHSVAGRPSGRSSTRTRPRASSVEPRVGEHGPHLLAAVAGVRVDGGASGTRRA